MAASTTGSVVKGMVWMLILSVLLFWLPVAGPLVAGFVGGRKSGGVGNAILAALLPGILLGLARRFSSFSFRRSSAQSRLQAS